MPSLVAKDVSLLSLGVVIAILIVVVVSITLIVRFLRGVVGEDSAEPPAGHTAWLEARGLAA
jgi:hypothetical protein